MALLTSDDLLLVIFKQIHGLRDLSSKGSRTTANVGFGSLNKSGLSQLFDYKISLLKTNSSSHVNGGS